MKKKRIGGTSSTSKIYWVENTPKKSREGRIVHLLVQGNTIYIDL